MFSTVTSASGRVAVRANAGSSFYTASASVASDLPFLTVGTKSVELLAVLPTHCQLRWKFTGCLIDVNKIPIRYLKDTR